MEVIGLTKSNNKKTKEIENISKKITAEVARMTETEADLRDDLADAATELRESDMALIELREEYEEKLGAARE